MWHGISVYDSARNDVDENKINNGRYVNNMWPWSHEYAYKYAYQESMFESTCNVRKI